jgi:hypothetical protein
LARSWVARSGVGDLQRSDVQPEAALQLQGSGRRDLNGARFPRSAQAAGAGASGLALAMLVGGLAQLAAAAFCWCVTPAARTP